jgi:flavin reductase (DIM6/NTAB) family NADH-FMN oxidoreductase RutF
VEHALGIRFEWPAAGIPVLGDVLVQLTCRVVASPVAGDHTIFLAEVESAEVFEGEPLLFFRGEYRRISPV